MARVPGSLSQCLFLFVCFLASEPGRRGGAKEEEGGGIGVRLLHCTRRLEDVGWGVLHGFGLGGAADLLASAGSFVFFRPVCFGGTCCTTQVVNSPRRLADFCCFTQHVYACMVHGFVSPELPAFCFLPRVVLAVAVFALPMRLLKQYKKTEPVRRSTVRSPDFGARPKTVGRR